MQNPGCVKGRAGFVHREVNPQVQYASYRNDWSPLRGIFANCFLLNAASFLAFFPGPIFIVDKTSSGGAFLHIAASQIQHASVIVGSTADCRAISNASIFYRECINTMESIQGNGGDAEPVQQIVWFSAGARRKWRTGIDDHHRMAAVGRYHRG